MGRVHVLPESLANRIAAGEVAERPASVLKELVENAVDAGAGRIEVRLKNGGKDLILVRDDGCGMSSEDAVMALRRHATSKIRGPEDLDAIGTMGFRGEALPSVGAVSRLEILTRPREQELGTRVFVEGGTSPETTESGLPAGTVVSVRELFYNVPARRRFLRSGPAELRHCTEVVTRAAMAHPSVGFTYVVDGRKRATYAPVSRVEERMRDVLGPALAGGMLDVDHRENGFRVRGIAGGPDVWRSSRSHQLLFVNRRPVQHKGLSGGLYALYRDHLRAGQFPVYVLLIEVDPARVDVNIHPSKAEVRFREEQEASRAVRHGVAEVLRAQGATPQWHAPSLEPEKPADGVEQVQMKLDTPSGGRVLPFVADRSRTGGGPPFPRGFAISSSDLASSARGDGAGGGPPDSSGETAPDLGALGAILAGPGAASAADGEQVRAQCWQFSRTYIFTPLKGDLLIVDQHVAHERVLYEQVLARMTKGEVPSQRLLFPVPIQVTPEEEEALVRFGDQVERVGYEVERVDDRSVQLLGVPAVGRDSRAGEIFHAFLGELSENGDVRLVGAEKVAATFACKAAVKAGDPLDVREMNELVDALFGTEQPFYCPHGRPIVVRVSLAEIGRRFGRF